MSVKAALSVGRVRRHGIIEGLAGGRRIVAEQRNQTEDVIEQRPVKAGRRRREQSLGVLDQGDDVGEILVGCMLLQEVQRRRVRRQLRGAPQRAAPQETHQAFAGSGTDHLAESADQVAATRHQHMHCSILDEEPEADGVRVAPQFALQSEGDILGMDSLEQRHARPWSRRERISGGRTTDGVEVISSSKSLNRDTSVCSSTEMASIFGAMATSTLPECITLSTARSPRPNNKAKANVVNSMPPPKRHRPTGAAPLPTS